MCANRTLAALKQPRYGGNKATIASSSSDAGSATERPASRWELRAELKQLRKELNERETRATGEVRVCMCLSILFFGSVRISVKDFFGSVRILTESVVVSSRSRNCDVNPSLCFLASVYSWIIEPSSAKHFDLKFESLPPISRFNK